MHGRRIPCLLFIGFFLSVVCSFALAQTGADTTPPEIALDWPTPGAVDTTGTPLIEVTYADDGAGIDEATLHLALDSVNVTDLAERETGVLRYTPSVPLASGEHEIYFGVRDNAGNLAEERWTFTVRLPLATKIDIGGSNSLLFNIAPLSKTTDTLDLTVGADMENYDIRLHALGHGTDYPDGSPFFSLGGYNAYLDKYTLEIRGAKAGLSLGYATLPLSSELFQISREIYGGVMDAALGSGGGRYDLSGFYGQGSTSYGLGISTYDLTGATGDWTNGKGTNLGGMFLSLDGANPIYAAGVHGRMLLGGRSLLRLEGLYGFGGAGDPSGGAGAAHLDLPLGRVRLGLDLMVVAPGYPLPGVPAPLCIYGGSASPDSGVLLYSLRSSIPFATHGVLTSNLTEARDNMDRSQAGTRYKDTLNLGYVFNPGGDLSLRAAWQGGLTRTQGGPTPGLDGRSQTLSLDASGGIGSSDWDIGYNFTTDEDIGAAKKTTTHKLSGSWSTPLGAYTLDSTLEYMLTSDGSSVGRSLQARMEMDGWFLPERLQGTVGLFYSDAAVREFGPEASLSLTLWHDSLLELKCTNYWWVKNAGGVTTGQNLTLSLEWITRF